MQKIYDSINQDGVKKDLTELHQKIGNTLRYNADQLCEIYQELYKNGYVINGFLGHKMGEPVFLAIDKGEQVIVRVFPIDDASEMDAQAKIMEKFRNQPYIHQFVKMFYSENKKYFFYIAEKLTCDLESIMLALKEKKSKLPYNQVVTFAIQMATALSLFEKEKFIHSDLKPANILYDINNKCFKISGYGFQTIIQQQLTQKRMHAAENVNGCTAKDGAPEVRKQNQSYACKIDDVFSLGLILLELIYSELSMLEVMEISAGTANVTNHLKNGQYKSLNELIYFMLTNDQSIRLSACDLLQKLKSLQSKEESDLHNYLDSNYLLADGIVIEQMKQLYSSSLTQVSLDDTITANSIRISMKCRTLKFEAIETIEQFIEVEEALSEHQSATGENCFLDIGLTFYGYCNELTPLGSSITSKLGQRLVMCSSSIITLSLSFQFLVIGFEGAKSLAALIEKCSKTLLMVGLKFHESHIGPEEIECISLSLEKCGAMITLALYLRGDYMGKNKIGPTGVSYLASSLPKYKSLIELTLVLWWQDIKKEGLESLGRGFEKCENLTRLNFQIHDDYRFSINEQPAQNFSSSLSKCPNLLVLNVDLNHQTYAILPRLQMYAKLIALTFFLWGDDQYSTPALQANLEQCHSLTSLCLRVQSWNLCNIIILVKSLESNNLTTLKLIFQYCTFDSYSLQTQTNCLGQSLLRFQKLASLSMFFCWYGSQSPPQFTQILLSRYLSKCENIETLSLCIQGNKIAPLEAKLISENLAACKYLKTLNLYLWWNSIGQDGALAISNTLKRCENLTALRLSVIEGYCCDDDSSLEHSHVQTKYMDSIAPTITNDLKEKCKNLQRLTVEVRSVKDYDNFYNRMLTEFSVLTLFEQGFWVSF